LTEHGIAAAAAKRPTFFPINLTNEKRKKHLIAFEFRAIFWGEFFFCATLGD
jgi:hypothetical protein